MATTAITVQDKPSGYSTTLTTLNFTAADVANGNHFTHPGGVIRVIARNVSTVTTYTITVASVADFLGRTGSITAQSIGGSNQAAGVKVIEVPFSGWANTSNSNHVDISATNANVEFAVIKV